MCFLGSSERDRGKWQQCVFWGVRNGGNGRDVALGKYGIVGSVNAGDVVSI